MKTLIKKLKAWYIDNYGKHYKVNLNPTSKEIHDIRHHEIRCKTHQIVRFVMVNKKEMKKYLAEGYNGCAYCLKKHDTG